MCQSTCLMFKEYYLDSVRLKGKICTKFDRAGNLKKPKKGKAMKGQFNVNILSKLIFIQAFLHVSTIKTQQIQICLDWLPRRNVFSEPDKITWLRNLIPHTRARITSLTRAGNLHGPIEPKEQPQPLL